MEIITSFPRRMLSVQSCFSLLPCCSSSFLCWAPMETDLFGEEMSRTRQGTDERNSRERRQKQTKACTQIHSCRKWNEKERRSSVFTVCFPGEVTRSHSYMVRCVEGATSPLWWITRSECNYNRSEYFRSAVCIWFRCTRAASLCVLAGAAV